MKLSKRKNTIISKLSVISSAITLFAIKSNMVFATNAGIGTAEVNAATDNIKRVITSIAMPLGRSSYFCKYSSCSN